MMAVASEQIPTTTLSILGALVAGLIAVIVLLVKTLGQARQATSAGEHLVAEVDALAASQRDFASRGWQTLPEPISTAAGLATTLSEMRHDINQMSERLAAHDAWERSQKHPPH